MSVAATAGSIAIGLLFATSAANAPRTSPVRVGPLTASRPDREGEPWTCKGTLAAAELKMLDAAPRIESDRSGADGPWGVQALSDGIPCWFAVSADGHRSAVVLRTGDSSHVVLLFVRTRLVSAQKIHGPWDLRVKPGAFPPVLQQLAEGDAGFLYRYDRKAREYREKPYPYRPGSD